MALSRRNVLALGAGAELSAWAEDVQAIPVRNGVPQVDHHAHPESGMTIARAVEISQERGVKLGLVQHAGVKDDSSSERVSSGAEADSGEGPRVTQGTLGTQSVSSLKRMEAAKFACETFRSGFLDSLGEASAEIPWEYWLS